MYHTELKCCSTANVLFMYKKPFVVLHDQLVSIAWFHIHGIGKKYWGLELGGITYKYLIPKALNFPTLWKKPERKA